MIFIIKIFAATRFTYWIIYECRYQQNGMRRNCCSLM